MLCTKYRPCDRDHTLTVDELPHSGSLEGAQGSISFGDCYVAMDDGTGFGNRNSQIGSSAVKPMDSPSGSNTQLWLTGQTAMADLIRATASPEWSMLDLSHASSHALQLRLAICPILFTKRFRGTRAR